MSEFPYQEPHPMGGTDGEPKPRNSTVSGEFNKNHEICQFCHHSRTALRDMLAEGGRGNLTIVEIVTGNCPACKRALGGKG